MVGVNIDPLPGLPAAFPVIFFYCCPFLLLASLLVLCHMYARYTFQVMLYILFFLQDLLQFILVHVEDKNVEPLLEVPRSYIFTSLVHFISNLV